MPTEKALLGAIFDVTNPKKVHDFLHFRKLRLKRVKRIMNAFSAQTMSELMDFGP